MERGHGWRKIIVFSEALVAFVLVLWLLQLKDSGAIVSVGSMIIGMVGATIYGNIKVHEAYSRNGAKEPSEVINGQN
jgi:hypothetical protein